MTGRIYFIQAGSRVGPIKIGFTRKDPQRRLTDFQVGCPRPLTLLGSIPAEPWHERLIQSIFYPLHIRGEWFRASADLRALARGDLSRLGNAAALLQPDKVAA